MTSGSRTILERAEAGDLSEADVAALVAHLSSMPTDNNTYTLLHALGHAGDSRFVSTVEAYLDSPDDPMLARLALQILCDYWGLGTRYRDDILRFMAGVPWDVEADGDVRLMAISSAGELMALTSDEDMAAKLLETFTRSEGVVREAAYAALVIGTGGSWADVPSPRNRSFEVDPNVIRKAREMSVR